MTRRTVTVVTGTRAEYGLLESSMRQIRRSEALELSVVVTGMHLSPQYGHTIDEIREDGFTVDREVHMLLDGGSGRSMAKSLGIGLSSFAETFGELDTDLVLVIADRGEAFAAALAAAHMNLPVAHIHGGDKTHGGTIYDSIRHALKKFAHLHFPASSASRERIERLGEEPWRITTVGAPGLDDVLDVDYSDPDSVRNRCDIGPEQPVFLVPQHPVTGAFERAGEQMRTTLDATLEVAEDVEARVIGIYPNADAGSKQMIDAIEHHPARDRFTVFENIPREDLLGLLGTASLMIDNSSSGLIEAPSFDLPVVEIGSRQSDRERADNVLTVAHDRAEIRAGIERGLGDEFARRAADCGNPYDRGGAASLICDRLASVELGDRLLRKQLTY